MSDLSSDLSKSTGHSLKAALKDPAQSDWDILIHEPVVAPTTPAPEVETTLTPAAPPVTTESPLGVPARSSLRNRVVLFLFALVSVLTLLASLVSAWTLRQSLTNEFASKGQAIAETLANVAPDFLVSRDATQVQRLIDDYAALDGVAYVVAQDVEGNAYAHTFAPLIPPELSVFEQRQHEEGGAEGLEVTELSYWDLETAQVRNILEVEVPVLGGQLGEIQVGMDKDLINAQVARQSRLVAGLLGLAGLAILLLGALLAQRLLRPIRDLAKLSEKVGRGDLSETVAVRSNDEIGSLSRSFNHTIVRLRGMVQTEEERDEERRRREQLQANISDFLDVAMDIADGDFSKRGEVTEGVLGNVVDAINLMVEELSELLKGVQTTAASVQKGSDEMISSTNVISQSVRSQLGEARHVQNDVQAMTRAMRQMREDADSSAQAAELTLNASERGREAVEATLKGMQAIRREAQTVSAQVEQLDKRSREISVIVTTIGDIAAQTNLLALGAALEAAGAGEAGRRFAVVAEEVGQLAEDAAAASRRVAALAENVQSDVSIVVSRIRQSNEEVESGVQVAREAKERLQDITELSQRSSQLVAAISQASRLQVQSVEHVDGAVQRVAGVAARSQETVLKGREAAEQLQDVAARLNESLARFRLS